MKYIVAVSGGVDSVALLHMLARAREHELIVAHFDHGVRSDSAADARFVQALATSYSLPCVVRREELGRNVSEDIARTRRYAFLRSVAKKHNAIIVTAHHADDIIESIAINIFRGTGWRGLAVMDSPGIIRPLLTMTKQAIRTYALNKRLEWVEDSTNAETVYLRNRMRRTISKQLSISKKRRLRDVWRRQLVIKQAIDDEVRSYLSPSYEYARYTFITVERAVAVELLRAAIVAVTGEGLTRPQLERALLAIKTAQPGAKYEAGNGVTLRFSRRTFIVQTP